MPVISPRGKPATLSKAPQKSCIGVRQASTSLSFASENPETHVGQRLGLRTKSMNHAGTTPNASLQRVSNSCASSAVNSRVQPNDMLISFFPSVTRISSVLAPFVSIPRPERSRLGSVARVASCSGKDPHKIRSSSKFCWTRPPGMPALSRSLKNPSRAHARSTMSNSCAASTPPRAKVAMSTSGTSTNFVIGTPPLAETEQTAKLETQVNEGTAQGHDFIPPGRDPKCARSLSSLRRDFRAGPNPCAAENHLRPSESVLLPSCHNSTKTGRQPKGDR